MESCRLGDHMVTIVVQIYFFWKRFTENEIMTYKLNKILDMKPADQNCWVLKSIWPVPTLVPQTRNLCSKFWNTVYGFSCRVLFAVSILVCDPDDTLCFVATPLLVSSQYRKVIYQYIGSDLNGYNVVRELFVHL